MNCDSLVETLNIHFSNRLKCQSTEEGLLVHTSMIGVDGDPIFIQVADSPNGLKIDDGSAIASILFNMNQEGFNDPGFSFVRSMARSHEVEIDRDTGTIFLECTPDAFSESFFKFMVFVSAVQTSLSHAVEPRRDKSLSSPMLRGQLRRHFGNLGVETLIKLRQRVAGRTITDWLIDFKYTSLIGHYQVLIPTVDLNVKAPIPRAEHIVSMALDIKGAHQSDRIRVVYNMPIQDSKESSESFEAAAMIKEYQSTIGYESFQFSNNRELSNFSEQVANELLTAESRLADSLW